MHFKGLNFTGDQLYRLIFHVVLWGLWIGLPIMSASDERARQFSIAIIPIALTNIPLFLLNSDWLIPKVFRKYGIGYYLLSLLVLIIIYAFFQEMLKEALIDNLRRHRSVFWAYVPVVFVTAISTGYGFINYLLKEEKTRHEEKEERLQSEVAFLRSQISPHFIFNVLNSIVYLIRSKSDQAEKVTLELSELMRYMLYESGDRQVALDKEVDYLVNYVALQKVRFGEDIAITLEVEGNPAGKVIEPMLLIPFVENAFKHGVGMILNPSITIQLQIKTQEITFSVRNKKTPETPSTKDSFSGIGLRNVARRLELLYPGRHQLAIQHQDDFFTVTLSLQQTTLSTL